MTQAKMKHELTLATIRTNPEKGNVKLLIKRLKDAICRAHEAGAQLVHTHEYAVDGCYLVEMNRVFFGVREKHKEEIEELKRFSLEKAKKIEDVYFPQFSELAPLAIMSRKTLTGSSSRSLCGFDDSHNQRN